MRLAGTVTVEEAGALAVIVKLAHEAAFVRAKAVAAVIGVLRDYVNRDGLLSPPRREIAQRLALTPEAVDAALGALVADGYLVELRPKGFVRRQRRFRLRMPGTSPPSP